MYSIITYFIAFKMIDIVVEGLEELKSVNIISDNPDPHLPGADHGDVARYPRRRG